MISPYPTTTATVWITIRSLFISLHAAVEKHRNVPRAFLIEYYRFHHRLFGNQCWECCQNMVMTWIWTGMVVCALLCGLCTGNLPAVAAAALDGAQSAVELSLSMAGILCLWSGVMEMLNACGVSAMIASLFRPLLRHLLPQASRDPETLAAVSANVSANLLGLGNAATPLGIQAACRMARGCGGTASDELCLLVVLNTASIQLLPTTVASVRAACGSAAPFDILPAVWISSIASVTVGLLTARLLSHRKGGSL